MKAYSYSRYSSDAQKNGSSIDRQQTLAGKYCKDKCIELSDRVYADEGVSGFHGANSKTGALGQFLADCESGDVEPGSYLILENLDRLTRTEPWNAVGLLQQLLTLGITVVTLRPEITFDPDKRDSMQLLQAVLFLDNAHKESARKSDLGKIEWAKRFERARTNGHHIGKRVSNWLDLGKDGKYHLNGHAATVREIFRLCLDGLGSTSISQALNAEPEKYPTFNRGSRWGTTAVLTILQNKAAIGQLVPKDGAEPIPNYFPLVVDENTFDAAQRNITARKTGKVTKQSADFNVWQKLVFCGACGSRMNIIIRNHRYLMCANRRYGSCEGSKNVRLDESEDVLMAMLLHLDAISLVMPNPERLHRDLTIAEGRLLAEQNKLAIWTDQLIQNPEIPTYHELVIKSNGTIKALKSDIENLKSTLTGGEKLSWEEIRAKLDLSDKATRRRINAFLHRLGVQVRIAEGYVVTQQEEVRAIFAVAKGRIGSVTLDAESGVIPSLEQANSMALGVKRRLLSSGIGYHGTVTVPNGRGVHRAKAAELKAAKICQPSTHPLSDWTSYDESQLHEANDLLDITGFGDDAVLHDTPLHAPDD